MSVVASRDPAVDAAPATRVVHPEAQRGSLLELRHVDKGYGSGSARAEVLEDVSLQIRGGEFLAIVGFSGSGKTTLAQLMAGLIRPDAGEILMRGQPIAGPGPERGLVFQNYSLLPWMTVYGNVALAVNRAFPMWSKARRREHVEKFIEMVNLTAAAHRRPRELSGGMRQRVSLARTLAVRSQVLLLDEPLSALDALTRGLLRDEILRIWEEERQTCVMITNDVDEALLMADRVIPLDPAPRASLGPAFAVELERPRDPKALNHNAHFRALRNSITKYLVDVRQRSRDAEAGLQAPSRLPQIDPVDAPRRGSRGLAGRFG